MEFDDVLREYSTSVYSFCARLIGNEEDARDLAQEIFIKIWKNIEKYDEKRSLKAWVFTIARNTCYDWLRKKKSLLFSQMNSALMDGGDSVNFEDTISDDTPLQDELFIQKENVGTVEKALSILPQDQLEVVVLHYSDNLSFEEIAQVLNKSINTVKSQNRRALEKMKNYLESLHNNNIENAPKKP